METVQEEQEVSPSSNFDGQGYKVYVNGIPLTDAEGISTFDDLDYSSVGNVEVTKGPAGTLYGLAISGAINCKYDQTREGKNIYRPGGDDGQLWIAALHHAVRNWIMNVLPIVLNYGHQKSDGFSIHNKSKKDFVNFSGNFRPI